MMMWDRYDDAMRDIDNDERDLKDENRKLEARLGELGVQVPPEHAAEDRPAKDHNDMYWNKSLDVIGLRARNRLLRELVEKAQSKGSE